MAIVLIAICNVTKLTYVSSSSRGGSACVFVALYVAVETTRSLNDSLSELFHAIKTIIFNKVRSHTITAKSYLIVRSTLTSN